MNLPNLLTVSRILMTFGFVFFMQRPGLSAAGWALGLFLLASLTDWADGAIARKYGLVTVFGKIMDPIADKFLVLTALFIFSAEGLFPLWMIGIIALREVMVTISRFFQIARGQVIPADTSGKIKTVIQLAIILLVLVIRVLWSWEPTSDMIRNSQMVWRTGLNCLMIIALGLTIWSGILYYLALGKADRK